MSTVSFDSFDAPEEAIISLITEVLDCSWKPSPIYNLEGAFGGQPLRSL